MDKIEQELRSLRKQIWLQRMGESKFAIGIILAIVLVLSWKIYRSSDKVIEEEKMFGVLIGLHQVQSKFRPSAMMLSIKLKNGETVLVLAPDNFVVRNNADVEVVRGKTEQGTVHYHFTRYRE